MTTIMAYILAIALAIAAGSGLWAYSERQARLLQSREIQSLKGRVYAADRARVSANIAAKRRGVERDKAREAEISALKRLDAALRGPAKDWAATQVPPEVRDAL